MRTWTSMREPVDASNGHSRWDDRLSPIRTADPTGYLVTPIPARSSETALSHS
jgi:hypothetical protein